MSEKSTIEWTDSTWNPVTGCNKISPGCKHCYAETFAERWRGIPGHPYEQGFDLRLWPDRLELPLTWKKPRRIFVNSMSDLFHEEVPLAFIQRVFRTMERASWHTFQILTKRSERLAELAPDLSWPPNVWMGVSVETAKYLWRADHLRKVPAAVRFLSLEPLLDPLGTLDLSDIHWVIIGGESGPGARPIEAGWVRGIRKQCRRQRVPFFFKQWGGIQKKKNGRLLDGQTWDGMPKGHVLGANRGVRGALGGLRFRTRGGYGVDDAEPSLRFGPSTATWTMRRSPRARPSGSRASRGSLRGP